MIKKSKLRLLRMVLADSFRECLHRRSSHGQYGWQTGVYEWAMKHALIEQVGLRETKWGRMFDGYGITDKGRELVARFVGVDVTSRSYIRHRGVCSECHAPGEHRVLRGATPRRATELVLRCDNCRRKKWEAKKMRRG